MQFNGHNIAKKDIKRYRKKFLELTNRFFNLLDSKPKPDKETIRTEFLKAQGEWKNFCLENGLSARTSELFNMKVSVEWENKYTRKG